MPRASSSRSWLIDLPTCTSTNTWALDHLAALAHGACVWTQRQTHGRGQNGASWYSPPGVLTASVVLDLPVAVPVAQLSLCAGLAVAHAVEDLAPAARISLKWPNDCYLDGRKLAGVLCERMVAAPESPRSASRHETRAAVVVGIGLNLDPQWDQQPAALPLAAGRVAGPASLAEVQQPVPDMVTMLASLRRYLLEATGLLSAGGWEQLLPHLRNRDWLRGRRVELKVGSRRVIGIAEGLDPDGSLVVRAADETLSVASGSILSVDV